MKVLLLNGSPHANGTTAMALEEMTKIFRAESIETETVLLGHRDIRGCIGCNHCFNAGKCVFDDIVNELAPKFEAADGLVVGSPVYFASANATLIACLDRLFFSTRFNKTMKVGAAVATARRGGITATFDELNKYFLHGGMAVPGGQYWNGLHGWNGARQEEISCAEQDQEGLQQMRTLARNMVFLMRAISDAKEKYGLPEKEQRISTSFIR